MKGKIWSGVQYFLALFILACLCYLFNNLKFNSLERFARDSLQFLNNPTKVNKDIVTLTLDSARTGPTAIYSFEAIHEVIRKLQEMEPRSIVICMEPLDFSEDPSEKEKLYAFLYSQKNVFINGREARNGVSNFKNDPIFSKYPRLIEFDLSKDLSIDKKNRRAIIQINQKGYSPLFHATEKIGLTSFPPAFFKHRFKYWNSEQAYIKHYPLTAFGNYLSTDLLANRLPKKDFTQKVIFIGIHDSLSFQSLPSVFNIFNKPYEHDYRLGVSPFHHLVANLINFHSTGTHIKLIQDFNGMPLAFVLLALLIVLNFSLKAKLFTFLSLVPLLICTQILIYISADYYVDLSNILALLVFIQYLALPILLFILLQKQERRKLLDIHNAKVDALFAISERVAHDIRSPLSAAKLLLSKAKFDNPEFKTIIESSLQRIDDISEKILIQHKRDSLPQTSRVDVVKAINSLIVEKQILSPKIAYTFPKTADLYAHGSELEISRVLSNILDNSIYALQNADQAKINISIQKKSTGYILISIADNGPGISNDVLQLLGREQITTKPNRDGHGIGLLYAKRVLERMHGGLDIESSVAGTVVHITLVEHI